MELTERQIAEILHADVKRLKKLSTTIPSCNRYLDPTTQIIFTRIKDGWREPGKILRITKGADNEDYYFLLFLCALTETNGKNTYFFELSNEPLEDENEEKKPFLGFGNGVLKLSSELDYYEIAPVQTGHKVVKYRTEDDDVVEHYFYKLDDSFVKKLATGDVGFEISVTDGEDLEIKFDIPSIRSNRPSFSDNWKKAYAQLENSEQVGKSATNTAEESGVIEEEKKSFIQKLLGLFK